MPITTYAELQSEIIDTLKRSDLTSRTATYIHLAESRINRKLRVRPMIATATINPSTVSKTTSLPTGFMEMISFTDDLGEELEAVSFDDLENLSYGTDTGRPTYYALDATNLYMDRRADQTYAYKMRYWKRLDLATDLTNEVLTEAPDIYLYGSLLMSAPDIKNDERIPVWASLFESAMREYSQQDNRTRRRLRTEFTGRSFNIIRGF